MSDIPNDFRVNIKKGHFYGDMHDRREGHSQEINVTISHIYVYL